MEPQGQATTPIVPTNHCAANSRNRQSALTRSIWRGVLQNVRSNSGLAMMIERHRARDVATFSRCGSSKNSIPRGASWTDDDAIE